MLKVSRKSRPSFASGFARSQADARYPELWEGLVYANDFTLGSTGLRTHDLSGRGNVGSLQNMDGSNWGKDGLTFNGTDEYVSTENVPPLGTGDFSVAVWCSAVLPSSATSPVMFGQGEFFDSGHWQMRIVSGIGGVRFGLLAFHTQGISIANPTEFSFGTGIMRHCCAVRKGTTCTLYQDGVPVAADTSASGDLSLTSAVYVGRNSDPDRFFPGTVATPSIYNRALSESEIRLLATRPQALVEQRPRFFPVAAVEETPTTTSIVAVPRRAKPSFASGFARSQSDARYPELWDGLVGAWQPNLGPTGGTLHDISGRSNSGVLTNMTANDWVTTETGWALETDLGSKKIVMQNGMLSSTGSIGFWFDGMATPQATGKFFVVADAEFQLYRNSSDTSVKFNVNNVAGLFPVTDLWGTGWHHVYAHWNADANLRQVAIDGNFSADVNDAFTWPAFGGSDLFWGNRSDDARTIGGRFSDISIYNRALSPSEIRLLASRPQALVEQRPRYYSVGVPAEVTTGSPWYYNLQQIAASSIA
jgi:hypothetical protein